MGLTREQAKRLLPVFAAWSEGKTVRWDGLLVDFLDVDDAVEPYSVEEEVSSVNHGNSSGWKRPSCVAYQDIEKGSKVLVRNGLLYRDAPISSTPWVASEFIRCGDGIEWNEDLKFVRGVNPLPCVGQVSSGNFDPVKKAEHYNSHPSGIEAIDVVRHFGFCRGSAIKYLWRAGFKDKAKEIQDLRKAIYYIEDDIRHLERKESDSE